MYTGKEYIRSLYSMNVSELQRELHLVSSHIQQQEKNWMDQDRNYISDLKETKRGIEELISVSFQQHFNRRF